MTPGPTIILKCSACGKLIAEESVASFTTFGERCWTDGKIEIPTLPARYELVKCGHCEKNIWIDEQKQVGEIEQAWRTRRCSGNIFLRLKEMLSAFTSEYFQIIFKGGSFKNARPYSILSAQDYFAALTEGEYDRQKERHIRILAWQAGNDMRRDNKDAPALSEDEIANLHVFAKLLDESDELDRIMKAEVMRELGDYEESMKLLSKPFKRKLTSAANIIKKLVEEKNPFVQEFID